MRLIRGWEKKYLPCRTGGLRLNKASMYHDVDELEGIGDRREGEVRLPVDLPVDLSDLRTSYLHSFGMLPNSQEAVESLEKKIIHKLYANHDDPNIQITSKDDGHYSVKVHIPHDVSGEGGVTPYVLCLSREPATKAQWEVLQASLPATYDTWTITDNIDGLRFEIECGIKRWLGLNGITQHGIGFAQEFISYDYDDAPMDDGSNATQLIMARRRWLRKSRKYQAQNEYRLLWEINSPQMPTMPDFIDIELTRTGISLFKTWTPPLT